MDERGIKKELRDLILDMAQKELDNYVSQKGIKKYFEGNIDKIINENMKKFSQSIEINKVYLRVLKRSSNQDNVSLIARVVKNEDTFKTKNELVKFARYLGINVNIKQSYNQILRKIANHIYLNKNIYSSKYISYKRGDKEYILEPDKIKEDLIESYKSKTRNDMRNIAKLLDLNTYEEDSAEEIRRKVINYIMKEKISKNK